MLIWSLRSLVIVLVASTMSACNFSRLKDDGSSNESFIPLSTQEKATVMNYSYINDRILKPKCLTCHDSGQEVDLSTYENIFSARDSIHRTVFVENSMPKKGLLTDNEKRLLWHWINLGSPKESDLGTIVPPADILPTFESIDRQILQNKCVVCHSPGESGKRIPLDKESLLNSPLELVIPGNADDSGLVIAVERTDEKRMPLAEEGYGPLSDKEKEAIRTWIVNGAKD
ncbi:MAG: hypothetical protein V4736_10790 [Bdellovibrionota bacterium]